MALGKHLFPCRTQQLSLAAVTILTLKRWENSTVPNYRIRPPNRRSFLLVLDFVAGPAPDRFGRVISKLNLFNYENLMKN